MVGGRQAGTRSDFTSKGLPPPPQAEASESRKSEMTAKATTRALLPIVQNVSDTAL